MGDVVPVRQPTLAEVKGAVDWTAAERRLLDECGTGEFVWCPGDGVPEKATDANAIRGSLIRFLLLGGDADHRPHPGGC